MRDHSRVWGCPKSLRISADSFLNVRDFWLALPEVSRHWRLLHQFYHSHPSPCPASRTPLANYPDQPERCAGEALLTSKRWQTDLRGEWKHQLLQVGGQHCFGVSLDGCCQNQLNNSDETWATTSLTAGSKGESCRLGPGPSPRILCPESSALSPVSSYRARQGALRGESARVVRVGDVMRDRGS